MTITLNMGGAWNPTDAQIMKWRLAFPGIDLEQEFAKIEAWGEANPKLRWTPNGAARGVHAWLSKAQNEVGKSARNGAASSPSDKKRAPSASISGDLYRHTVALDQLVTANLHRLDAPTLEGTFKFKLERLADAIVEGERKRYEAGEYSSFIAYASACYGTAYATLVKSWVDPPEGRLR